MALKEQISASDPLSSTILISEKPVVEELHSKGSAVFKVYPGSSREKTVRITLPETIIGRAGECHFRLDVPSVSRFHARVFARGHEYVIEDLGSTNGTFVNGVQVLRCVLRHSDQIQLGQAKIYFFEERACHRKAV